jgi:hypothetical protein
LSLTNLTLTLTICCYQFYCSYGVRVHIKHMNKRTIIEAQDVVYF